MLQPGSGGVGEEQGKVTDDEVVIVCPTQLVGQSVVRKPQFRLLKGKCALGPFLSILVIECQHK
jgi:hypothetical protein